MDDPRQLWDQARALDAEAGALRDRAIRAALAATDYRLRPTAAALGIPHTSLLRLLTAASSPHLAAGAEWRAREGARIVRRANAATQVAKSVRRKDLRGETSQNGATKRSHREQQKAP